MPSSVPFSNKKVKMGKQYPTPLMSTSFVHSVALNFPPATPARLPSQKLMYSLWLAFARSTTIISTFGRALELGYRHRGHILLDEKIGEMVHIYHQLTEAWSLAIPTSLIDITKHALMTTHLTMRL
ncbi:uncharacterized protein N7479_010403 [Penicillium vulpinum]|uniref:uncharacterized protein n=1 Tax=Penicillium vulpinum TaxID=29845 RepID=UPI002547E09E|nr:uncharacterized protein N7479_010403 [Penicillium vulpinum]KAJ5951990.1 hypothetical protein N7479_010403 [Penicillium vulpinum]